MNSCGGTDLVNIMTELADAVAQICGGHIPPSASVAGLLGRLRVTDKCHPCCRAYRHDWSAFAIYSNNLDDTVV